MTPAPFFDDVEFSYENVYVECHSCHKANIFNRVSDLNELGYISGMDVQCLHCQAPFRIGGDTVNPRHQLLLYDCNRLFKEKRYTACVLYAAQAFEVFCSLFLRIELAYKPYSRESKGAPLQHLPVSQLNALMALLYDTIRRFAFVDLRNVFLNTVLSGTSPANIAAAQQAITALPSLRDRCPSDASIAQHSDPAVAALLQAFKNCSVHELRNSVVHQAVYLPSAQEAEASVTEAGNILYPLGTRLGVLTEDFGWHHRQT
jgi:hypothetical protein